jgi:hypothetical protein
MARTEAGAVLTADHRDVQLQVRSRALRDFMTLWPLWTGDDASFDRLVAATLPLVRSYHSLSTSFAAAYYDTFRRTERVAGDPTPRLAPSVDPDRVATSLQVTGRVMTRQALLAGLAPRVAMQTALVRTSGAVTRHVLAGGRETLMLSTEADPQAHGWARVTSGHCCAFCAMLSSRGPVYGEDSVRFRAHDHCACSAEPSYEGSEWPGRAREFAQLWRDHKGAEDPLNSFRRAIEGA